MYNLYFKGLSTNNAELNQIRELFKTHNLDFTALYDDYGTLPLLLKHKLKMTLDDRINERNPMGQNFNLICHSMGCNLGVIAAEHSKKIKSMVLISPEFGEYSDEEKIIMENVNKNNSGVRTKLDVSKVKSFILFKKTQPIASVIIERINVPTLIIYSKDDPFIPKDYLNDLADRKDNIELSIIDTNEHNPLLNEDSKSSVMRLIKKHIC